MTKKQQISIRNEKQGKLAENEPNIYNINQRRHEEKKVKSNHTNNISFFV